MIAGDPITIFLFLEAEPDSPGCILRVQQISEDGLADAWEREFPRMELALAQVERDYGIGPDDWIDLDD